MRDITEADCAHCGHPKDEHRLANYADGAFVGESFLICPRAVWISQADARQQNSGNVVLDILNKGR